MDQGETDMLRYILVLFAVLMAAGEPSMESLTSMGPAMDYVVAFGIAVMLKPWLEAQFD